MFKALLGTAVLMGFALSGLAPSSVHAQGVGTLTMVVNCDAGDTIQEAVDKSREGTDILVSGLCNESVRINRDRINVRGQGGASISAPVDSASVFTVRGRNVEIRNFAINAAGVTRGVLVDKGAYAVIADSSVSNSGGSGIDVLNGSFADIRRNIITDSAVMGIFLFNGATASINRNIIERSGNLGIQLDGGVQATVSDNEIRDSGAGGIFVRVNSGAWIASNIIEDNVHNGIGVDSSSSAQISANTITGNGISGVAVDRNGSVLLPSFAGGANLIEGNKFHGMRCGVSGSLEVGIAQDFGSGNAPSNELIQVGCHN